MLLTHHDAGVATAAAIGLWLHYREGDIPDEVRDLWRGAIVRASGHESFFGEIIRQDATLVADWLQHSLCAGHLELIHLPKGVVSAITALPESARSEMLANVREDLFAAEVINLLIGDSVEVYKVLLRTNHLQNYRFAPLAHPDHPRWADMIVMALDAGHSVDDVATGTLSPPFRAWRGEESTMWQKLMDQFSPLLTHKDQRVRQVAELARHRIGERQKNALEREHHQAVYGGF
jgi:hypothetical protein